jgi:PIN domain nuclease of toxin-antitoxin system
MGMTIIDTSTFLWFISGDSRLSHTTKTLISEIDNEIFLSIASLWEIAIKMSIGKLELSMSYEDLLSAQIEDNEIKLLPIEKNHLDKKEKRGRCVQTCKLCRHFF